MSRISTQCHEFPFPSGAAAGYARSPDSPHTACRPAHGHAIAKHIQRTSEDLLQVETGSLYPALHRLEAKGWIAASWELSYKGKRARFYRLTRMGRKQLVANFEVGDVLSRDGIDLESGRSGGIMNPFFQKLPWL